MSQDHSQFIFPGPPVYGGGAGHAVTEAASSAIASPTTSTARSALAHISIDGGARFQHPRLPRPHPSNRSWFRQLPAPSSLHLLLVGRSRLRAEVSRLLSKSNPSSISQALPPFLGVGQSDCIAMVGISFVSLGDFQNACKDKANKLSNAQVSVSTNVVYGLAS